MNLFLPSHIRRGLVEVAFRFREADVAYLVGGSAMLRLRGIDVPVGDIDLVVAAGERDAVERALHGCSIEIPPQHEPWRTAWLIRTSLETAEGIAHLDVMGDLALLIDGLPIRFPLTVNRIVQIEGIDTPLASLAHWYHLYRAYNPDKAAMIRPHLDQAAIRQAASDLSIAG